MDGWMGGWVEVGFWKKEKGMWKGGSIEVYILCNIVVRGRGEERAT